MSGYLRLRMSEKKRCNVNRRDDIVRLSGNELWKRVFPNNSSPLNQEKDEEVADGLSDNSSRISKRMDSHNYVNKEMAFVNSNDIM